MGSSFAPFSLPCPRQDSLLRFLRQELCLPSEAIALVQRQESLPSLMPMVLWQYGLVTYDQLEQILDWLEFA